MPRKIAQISWPKRPPSKENNEFQNCAEEIQELVKFASADLSLIKASEDFKLALRDKLWQIFELELCSIQSGPFKKNPGRRYS